MKEWMYRAFWIMCNIFLLCVTTLQPHCSVVYIRKTTLQPHHCTVLLTDGLLSVVDCWGVKTVSEGTITPSNLKITHTQDSREGWYFICVTTGQRPQSKTQSKRQFQQVNGKARQRSEGMAERRPRTYAHLMIQDFALHGCVNSSYVPYTENGKCMM